MNAPKILIDGIESISVADGIVRMSFFSYTQSSYSGKPGHEKACEIITSPAGLARLREALESISEKLPQPTAASSNSGQTQSNEPGNKNTWDVR